MGVQGLLRQNSEKREISTDHLQKIKNNLDEQGHVYIDGPTMKLLLKEHGATNDDLALMESGYIHERVPHDQQPLMQHRQVAMHRMLLDETKNEISPARTNGCVQIVKSEIASSSEDGATLNYRRHGTRWFELTPDVYSRSSIPAAMAAISMKLLPKKYHAVGNIDAEHPVTINDQVLMRVQHKSNKSDAECSPTPEGIHQDNTEISSVTLINRFHVTHGGESRLWTLDAPTGNYKDEDFHTMKDTLVLDYPLQHQWESVFFNDRILKHEARAFYGGEKATRDVLVNFIRKPLKDGTDVKLSMESFVSI